MTSMSMQDLVTTLRYMHLSPAAIESAIRLPDQPFGNTLATGTAAAKTINR